MKYHQKLIKLIKGNSLLIFVHPALLALYTSIIIIIVIPNYFPKYDIKIIDKEYSLKATQVYYHDMDGDEITERIIARYNNGNSFPDVSYYDVNGFTINQWNLRGNWMDGNRLFFGDFNHNKFAEVYCFTRVQDSIFLHVKELLLRDGLEIKEKYICEAGLFNIDDADIYLSSNIMMDIDRNGFDEYLFSLKAGFSKQPRNTFIYNIQNDSLESSPLSASSFSYAIEYCDINNDGLEEITGIVPATENIHHSMPYTDSTAWLMVLDPNNGLNFLFEPIKFDGGLTATVFPTLYSSSRRNYIATTFLSKSAEKNYESFSLKLFNEKGVLLKEQKINFKDIKFLKFLNMGLDYDNYFHLMDSHGNTYISDTNLNLKTLNKLKIGELQGVDVPKGVLLDADGDGKREFLTKAKIKGNNNLLVYRNNLKEATLLDLESTKALHQWNFSIKKEKPNTDPIIVMQTDTEVLHIMYGKSTIYLFKYPIYIIAYLLIFLVFWFLQKLQTKAVQKKFDIEKRLIRQQLTISKQQLEPHFLLNVLNNIGAMFLENNKKDAQYYFGKFTSLIHHNLEYADKIEISLAEELKFIEDYLALQKKRLNEELSYTIESDFEINLKEIKIPHSLIFTFVENSIKHGLFPKTNNRVLKINVKNLEEGFTVNIIDNGIGRKKSKEINTHGTGKGLWIAKNIMNSYNKLNKRSISFIVDDLFDNDGIGIGTSIKLNI